MSRLHTSCTFFGGPLGVVMSKFAYSVRKTLLPGVNGLSSSLLLSRFWSSRMHWFVLLLMRGQFCARGARRESTSARSKRNLFGGRSEGWCVFKLVLKSVRLSKPSERSKALVSVVPSRLDARASVRELRYPVVPCRLRTALVVVYCALCLPAVTCWFFFPLAFLVDMMITRGCVVCVAGGFSSCW